MGSPRNVAFIALLLLAALAGGVGVALLTWHPRPAGGPVTAPGTEPAPAPAPAQPALAAAEGLPAPAAEPVAAEVQVAERLPERQAVLRVPPPTRLVVLVRGSLRPFNRPVGDGLQVEVGLREAPLDVRVRQRVRAEADRYAAELSLPWPLETATLYARIDEPGLQRRIVLGEVPAPTAQGLLPDVFLDPLDVALGSTVLVRVVDSIGQVLSNARVQALHGRGVRDPGGMYPVSSTQDLGSGLFLVHAPPKLPLFLVAELDDVGRAVRELGPMDLGADVPLEMKLVGTGELAGHLLDASGEGILGMTISAGPLERFEALERGAGWVDLHSAEGGGLLEGSDVTDAEGRFRIGGLRTGEYVLSASPELLQGLNVGREVHATGEDSIVLRLDLRWIELAVSMEDGRPVEESWAAQGRPYCLIYGESVPSLGGLGREGLAPNQRFAVWPGREYVVGWTTGSFALERTVLFPTDATFERVELRLPSQPRLGRARIDVRDARGQPFGERYQIAVESLAGAQELLSVSSDGPSTSIELPEGRHLLIVATQALAPFLQSLDVEADRTTQVEVVLRPGGSLNLLVEADVDPLQDPRGGPDPLLRARAEWITHGRAVPLGFLDPRHPAARPRTFFAATLLTTGITRLPAGRQVVEVTLDGFEPRRVEVDVVEGQAADVTVRLERP